MTALDLRQSQIHALNDGRLYISHSGGKRLVQLLHIHAAVRQILQDLLSKAVALALVSSTSDQT